MKKLLSLIAAASLLLVLPRAALAEEQPAATTLYVVKDFYEVNWHRDWWDAGPKGITGAAGSVEYSALADSMTVTYTGSYPSGNNIMWGQDNQISRNSRDFSDARFFVNEVKNESDAAAKYELVVSNSSEERDNFYAEKGGKYYLRTRDGAVTEHVFSDAFFALPAGFDGYAIVPVESYSPECNLTNVTRFSLGFPRGESGRLTFRRMGCVKDEGILSGAEIAVSDPTKYFVLPEEIVLEKAPYRPITEPETARENNVVS